MANPGGVIQGGVHLNNNLLTEGGTQITGNISHANNSKSANGIKREIKDIGFNEQAVAKANSKEHKEKDTVIVFVNYGGQDGTYAYSYSPQGFSEFFDKRKKELEKYSVIVCLYRKVEAIQIMKALQQVADEEASASALQPQQGRRRPSQQFSDTLAVFDHAEQGGAAPSKGSGIKARQKQLGLETLFGSAPPNLSGQSGVGSASPHVAPGQLPSGSGAHTGPEADQKDPLQALHHQAGGKLERPRDSVDGGTVAPRSSMAIAFDLLTQLPEESTDELASGELKGDGKGQPPAASPGEQQPQGGGQGGATQPLPDLQHRRLSGSGPAGSSSGGVATPASALGAGSIAVPQGQSRETTTEGMDVPLLMGGASADAGQPADQAKGGCCRCTLL